MKTLRLFACVSLLTPLLIRAETAPVALDALVNRPDLWQAETAALEPELKTGGFQWTSASRDGVRADRPGLTFLNRPVYEALLGFQNEKPVEVTLLYFNRGDAGDLRKDQFEKLLAEVSADLTALTGKPPVDRGRDATSAVKAEGYLWETPTSQYLLEWSVTKESRAKGIPFRAEFLRLSIQPPQNTPRAIGATEPTSGSRAAVRRFVGRDQVEKIPGGAVRLKNVPMVDQGQKGYCVVASVERVMRYYGASVDQHELAQMAGSDAEKGTSTDAMLNSLKKLTARLGVRIKDVENWNTSDFLKLIEDYNRATRRGKLAPEIKLGGSFIDVGECYAQMDPALYREIRLKKTADFGKFQREIQRSIDEGIPLLWSVQLGMVAETGLNPQSRGGHMRLIVGYDPATKEVLYSDSWGMGHEEKRMSWEDAWTITSGLSIMQPIS